MLLLVDSFDVNTTFEKLLFGHVEPLFVVCIINLFIDIVISLVDFVYYEWLLYYNSLGGCTVECKHIIHCATAISRIKVTLEALHFSQDGDHAVFLVVHGRLKELFDGLVFENGDFVDRPVA